MSGATDAGDTAKARALVRWRLVLGKYANRELSPEELSKREREMDEALSYLYDREYAARGYYATQSRAGRGRTKAGSLDPSALTAVQWLGKARALFGKAACERLQRHAVEKYDLSDILNDPEAIRSLEPSRDLLKVLLSLRVNQNPETLDAVRELIGRIVDDIMKRIHSRFVSAATGRRDRSRTSSLAQARNFDWRRTLKANLSRWDPGLKRLGIDRPRFNARVNRSFPWDIVLLVDQSGSMASSVIYAAVTAGILNSLPAVRTRLVAFDTSIVDLSSIARDPVEVLMSVSLGGGTDIGKALGYASTLIGDPRRTIVALISDFSEGASPGTMLAQARTLASAGVRLLGIAALDDEANPVYDRAMAERLADRGMEIAALTPLAFADWLGSVMG